MYGPKNNNNNNDTPKPTFDFVYSIPYINEGFTRKVKAGLKEIGINARIVPIPGKSLKSIIKSKPTNECKCFLCLNDIPCNEKNIVYEATCQHCKEKYIGATSRPAHIRISEHEHAIRLKNKRTTLGQHFQSHFPKSPDTNIQKSKRSKPNFEKLWEHFTFKKAAKGKDIMDLFIKEGLVISRTKPKVNNMMGNGLIR